MRAAVLTLILLLLLPAAAAAQQANCPPDGPLQTAWMFPRSTSGLVPTNALLWLMMEGPESQWPDESPPVRLLSLGGEGRVQLDPVGVVDAGSRRLHAYRATNGLTPETDYEVWFPINWLGEAGWNATDATSFRTGDGPMDAQPDMPGVLGSDLLTDQSRFGRCEWNDYVDRAVFDVDPAGAVFVIAAREDIGIPDTPFGMVGGLGLGNEVVLRDDLAPGLPLNLRFAGLSLTGEHTPWSEPEQHTMPAPGCRSVDGGAPFLAVLLLAVPLGLRRKEATWVVALALGLSVMGSADQAAAEALETTTLDADTTPELQADLLPTPRLVHHGTRTPADNPAWRSDLRPRLRQDLLAAGITTAVAAGVQTLSMTLIPPRAPHALQIAVANQIVLLPSSLVFATLGALYHDIYRGRRGRSIERALRGAAGVFFPVGVPLLTAGVFLGLFGTGSVDPSFFPATISVGLGLTFAGVTCAVWDDEVRATRRMASRTPAPRVLAAGPTGFVLAF